MTRSIVAIVCVLTGCAIGAVLPKLTAQSFPANPQAPRWEQFCSNFGGIGNDGASRTAAIERMNATLAARGREGFELVNVPMASAGRSGAGGTIWPELIICFKRPMPGGV